MRNLIFYSLAPRSGINPLVYILLAVSVFIGFAFSPIQPLPGIESILYNTVFLFDKGVWGMLLFFTALLSIMGLLMHKEPWIFVGGLGGFMLWLFACISLVLAGQLYVLSTVGILHLLFHGYLYLGAATGALYRKG